MCHDVFYCLAGNSLFLIHVACDTVACVVDFNMACYGLGNVLVIKVRDILLGP